MQLNYVDTNESNLLFVFSPQPLETILEVDEEQDDGEFYVSFSPAIDFFSKKLQTALSTETGNGIIIPDEQNILPCSDIRAILKPKYSSNDILGILILILLIFDWSGDAQFVLGTAQATSRRYLLEGFNAINHHILGVQKKNNIDTSDSYFLAIERNDPMGAWLR
jgi:hypothetical protein